jgi:hypothetical protein
MKMTSKLIVAGLLLSSTIAVASFEPWKDYQESDAVWSMTTIRVHPNMDDVYLEGLANTWVQTNEVAKKLGQIEDYEIYRSGLPQAGEFNLLLVVKFKDTSELGPNKAKYDAFMKELGKPKSDELDAFAQKNYPAMRDITGEYLMRKITLTKKGGGKT